MTEKNTFKKWISLSMAALLCVSVSTVSVQNAVATDGETSESTGGETTTTVDSSFVVEETAAIRISDPSGMRFYANIGEGLVDEVKAAESFGFLIFPQVYLTYEGAGVADWHVKYNAEDPTAEYGLYDYVEVSTTDVESAVYQREKDGKWCVNGVLHDVTEADRTLEFAAIAYYVKEGDYVYADFNEDFSRSLEYVAQQSYIEEATKRTALTQAFDWLESSTFKITSGADMTRLSAAVKAGSSFENISFQLSKTIAVGSDYEAVPDTFAGDWSYNGYALLVVDNEVGRGFVSDTYNKAATFTWREHYNGVAVMSSKLIDGATAKFWTGSSVYVDNENVTVANTSTADDSIAYDGKAAYIALGAEGSTSAKNTYLSITTNGWCMPAVWTTFTENSLRELNAAKELYSSVKIRVYVAGGSESTRFYDSGTRGGGIIGPKGYTTEKLYVPMGYWQEWTFTIDELIDICLNRSDNVGTKGSDEVAAWFETDSTEGFYNGMTLLPLGRPSAKYGIATLYIGDCVFVK